MSPKDWMLGCVTPNLSIRLRSVSNADSIVALISVSRTVATSELLIPVSTFSLRITFAKISGDASCPPWFSNSETKSSK